MQEEIFGPILPVSRTTTSAMRWRRSTPASARWGCTSTARTPQVAEGVLRQTTSGGACVNICAVQGALPSLGFGGSGHSGTGRHHGIEGFREFSNPRGVVVRGTGDLADAFLPPYGPAARRSSQRVRPPRQPGQRPPQPRCRPCLSRAAMGDRSMTRPPSRRRGPDSGRTARAVLLAARWVHEGRRLDMQGIADELGVSRVTLFRPRRQPRGAAGHGPVGAHRTNPGHSDGPVGGPAAGRRAAHPGHRAAHQRDRLPVQGAAPAPGRRARARAAGADQPPGPGPARHRGLRRGTPAPRHRRVRPGHPHRAGRAGLRARPAGGVLPLRRRPRRPQARRRRRQPAAAGSRGRHPA